MGSEHIILNKMKKPNEGMADVTAGTPNNRASNLPTLGDQLRRSVSRFKDKPLTFLSFGAVTALLLFGFKTILTPVFTSGEQISSSISLIDFAYRGFIAFVLLGLTALPVTAVAFGAAYKITGLDALKHALKRAMRAFMTGATAFFTQLLPSALVIPGLIMSSRFSIMLPVVVVEGKTGFEALGRSWNLVNGYTKDALRNMLLPLLAFVAVVAVTGLTMGLLAWPVFASLVLILPFAQILFQVMYEDLNRIKGTTAPIMNGYGVYQKLAVLGLILAIGVMAAGSLNIYNNGGQDATKVAMETPTKVSEPKETEKPKSKAESESGKDRDWQRYQDITALRLALNSHFNDTGSYPDDLNELVPKYIKELPFDPVSGNPYHYARNESAFSLGFSLEEGVAQLGAGGHELTPSGFDTTRPTGGTPSMPATPARSTNTTSSSESASSSSTGSTDSGDTGSGGSIDYGSNNTYNTYNTYTTETDTDSDGLTDEQEETLGTNPLTSDSDNDGLIDSDEIDIFGTDPNNEDTDSDGFSDAEEIAAGTDPVVPNTDIDPPSEDSSGDGGNAEDTGDDDSSGDTIGGSTVTDTDNDGLADTYEETAGTDPNNPDTDGDGLADGDEIMIYGTNPLSPDTDLDGVSDSDEILAGTNPLMPEGSGGSGDNSGSGDTSDDGYTGGGGGGGGGGSSYEETVEHRIALFGLHEPTLSTLGFWHPAWPGL